MVYTLICKSREPIAFRGQGQNGPIEKPFLHESLILPLGADGETVDHILAIGSYSFGENGRPI
jgi:hypothetical protein